MRTMTDANKNQQKSGSKGSLLVSALIMFILKIVSGVSSLFHIKGTRTFSNMKGEEREYFSSMLDDMKQDWNKKNR